MEGILEKAIFFPSFPLPFFLSPSFQLFFVYVLYSLLAFPFMPLFPLSFFLRSLLQDLSQLHCSFCTQQTVYVITRKGDLQSI
jgi:hypothetical protein